MKRFAIGGSIALGLANAHADGREQPLTYGEAFAQISPIGFDVVKTTEAGCGTAFSDAELKAFLKSEAFIGKQIEAMDRFCAAPENGRKMACIQHVKRTDASHN
jgi:hypothetical protein